MIRDILNYQGTKIGELELPDDTSEQVWAEKLAPYAVAPPTPQQRLSQALSRTVAEGQAKAQEVMDCFKKDNLAYFIAANLTPDQALLKSLWTHHRLRAVPISIAGLDLTIDLMNLVVSGDIETAYFIVLNMVPDDMTQPEHFLSSDRLAHLADLLRNRIG